MHVVYPQRAPLSTSDMLHRGLLRGKGSTGKTSRIAFDIHFSLGGARRPADSDVVHQVGSRM